MPVETIERSQTEPRTRWRWISVALLLVLLIFLALGCLARGLNHDEHQFVASGALLARAGLLPYLDYPYFHLPNLVFVFAGLFSTNSFLLLTARSFNVLCAWLLLLVFFSLTLAAFRSFGEKRWPIATAFTLLLALNPLCRLTAGRAWNHDLPMLASVAAFAALLRALKPNGSSRWMVVSGALLGIAIGTRLTFAPLVIPFVLLTWMFRATGSASYRGTLLFLGGMSVALLPTLALFVADPKAFLFNNLTANGALNLSFRQAAKPENLVLAKLRFLFRVILKFPSNLLLLASFVLFAGWFPSRQGWRAALRAPETAAVIFIVPFALLGALLPTPSYRQYYWMVVPFLFLGVAFGIARYCNTPTYQRRLRQLLIFALIVGLLELLPDLWGSGILTPPGRWATWAIHEQGLEIRRRTGAGPVLTLAPIYPLEGGAGIYKEFCTGPFAWRVSPFASEQDRARYGLVQESDLETYLSLKPPAILTHVQKRALEQPLINYARKNQYTETHLTGGGVLWLRPNDTPP